MNIKDAFHIVKPLNAETLLGSKPVSDYVVGPFGLCPYCHDAFCVDGKNACVDCETLLGEEAK